MDEKKAKEELKKCPFCGGEAKLNITRGFKREVIAAFVYCTKCGVGTLSYTLAKTAKEAWNRRLKNEKL